MDSTSILNSKSTPVSFLEWLESQERISPDYSINFKNYQGYIKEWSSTHNDKTVGSKDFYQRLYIDLLREITLNFSTEEEKRFIINFDFSKLDNIDIIIPFFIDKLKEICLFYSEKRESLRDTISLIPLKGTNFSIKKIVKNIILNELTNKSIEKESEGRVVFPSLSAINKNLEIKIDELYDTTNYYDSNRPQASDNIEFNKFGKVDIDSDLYLDFKEAIHKSIREYPLFLTSLLGNFSINYTLTGDDLDLLKQRDFLNYINTLSSKDLKLNFKRRLAPKYVSSDFYYLSVGNTFTDITTGILFSTKPLTGSNIQNLSNRYEANIAAVQTTDNLFTSYELGKFFLPSFTGVLQYNTFKKDFAINYNKLTPNSVYVFPDPNVIEDKNSVLAYKVKVDWNKIGPEGGASFGSIITDSHYQRFYPYESYSQDIGENPYGLSLFKDNVDFWAGNEDSTWTESHIWPGFDEIDRLQINTRLESLLIDSGVLSEWYTDIYGNQFGLYKNFDDNPSLYNRKKVIAGDIFIRNTVTGLVSTIKHFFNRTFLKYPSEVYNDLIDKSISFYLIKNVFVIETKNYVVVDSYECDLEDGTFINSLLPGIYIPKHNINENLEKYINSFYVESKNRLYLCFLKLNPSLSATNYKSLIPSIFELDIDNLNLYQRYPSLSIDATYYSLSSNAFKTFPEIDLRYIEGGKFSFKERFDLFNLTYCAYNLNNIPFYINEQFSIQEGNENLQSFGSLLHKPYMYVHDHNYINPDINHTVRYGATYSELVGGKDSRFKWEIFDAEGKNSYFCSNINPVIINRPGSHYVQFDWDKYLLGSVFIGCEAISVSNVDGVNIVGFRDGTPSITLLNEDTVYKIRDYTFFGYNFSLSASRPYNTEGSIVHFTISTDTSGFSGNFCNNLYSIYRKVFVHLVGDGLGSVGGDPYCVDCPPVCEFVYPLYSTITLIPSAGYRSRFSGWLGSPCEGIAGNCNITITDTTSVSAVFLKIPYHWLRVTSNLSGTKITTTDGNINCGDICEYEYQDGTLVGVSAGPAPLGYQFDTFKGGPLCGVNNPCGVTMISSYNLTATYVEAFQDIIIKKEYLNLEYGYILARAENGGTRTLYLPSADRAFFYNKNVTGLVGSITCSLSPETPIRGYAEFLKIPRSTFVSLTGRGDDKPNSYIFSRWRGTPCSNIPSTVCNFNITNNYSVTGVINVPTFSLAVQTSGSGVFYVESEDGKINCGTRSFINTRRDCFDTYLSGTFVYLSGVCAPGSKLFALCANDTFKNVEDPDNIFGKDKLELGLYVNEDTVLTAVGAAETLRTLTVIKSGSNEAINCKVMVRVVGQQDFILDRNVERATYVLPINSDIEIHPQTEPPFNRHLYTLGFSGLYYKYDAIGFTISPETTASLFQLEDITPRGSVINVEDNGAPFYHELGISSPVSVFNRESYLTLNTSATAILVYQSIDFIAKQENIEDPVYTEDQRYFYT